MADNILNYTQMIADTFEPKMKNRYYMEMTNVGIPAYMVKAANRPEIQFETVKIDHINVYRKLKGKGEWQDLQITLYDPVVPSAAQLVMEWVRLSHESITGRDGYAEFYKKDISFYMLGPVGDKVEQWTLKGAFISRANFGELDFSNTNEPATIELTLTYDYAILEY
jgi:hypothetical protein